MSELQLVMTDGNKKIYKYSPTRLRPLYKKIDAVSIGRLLRYQYEIAKGGYLVYYLEVDGNLVAQNIIIPGGRRMKITTEKDVVIGGPYFTIPEMRGKGYISYLIRNSLLHCEYDWENAYDYIKKINTASIHTTEGLGFKKIGEANITGLFHKIRMVDHDGEFNVYRISKQDLKKISDSKTNDIKVKQV